MTRLYKDLGVLMQKPPSWFATEDEHLLKRTPAMIEFLKQTSNHDLKQLKEHTDLSGSVYLSHDSYTAVRLSAGSAINAFCAAVEIQVKCDRRGRIARPPCQS